MTEATRPPMPPPPTDENDGPDLPEPVDLRALMTSDPPATEWFAEPIIPAGKLVGFVGKRGDGKSLLLLDIAAAKAAGRPVLGRPAEAPAHLVYLDLEMGPDDLYDRLSDLGYHPDDPHFDRLVEHLHYYQLPSLPPLDTQAGGEALERIVERHQAIAVVIDTVSRVISGAENDAEPFRDLFRHTETRLKRRRVTVARLDHFGKDVARGARGSSAKEDPLDVVWELRVPGRFRRALKRTKGRQNGLPDEVWINLEERNGVLAHEIPAEPAAPWLDQYAAELDRLNVPTDATVTETQKALREAGIGKSRKAVCELVAHRRNAVPNRSEPPSGTTHQNHQEPEHG